MYNMSKFGWFLGRISAKTCLKMDYFGSKSPQIAKSWGLRPPDPLASGGWGFAPRPQFRLND